MVLAIALDNRDRWRELAQQLQGDGASAVLGDLANDLRMKSASNTAQISLRSIRRKSCSRWRIATKHSASCAC